MLLIPTDKTLLATHRRCLDGTGSAYAFIRAGGKRENVRFLLPSECRLATADVGDCDEVWFADVCPTASNVRGRIADDSAGGLPFRVFDHHLTNARRFPDDPRCTFRMDRSGTSLMDELLGGVLDRRLVSALEAYDLGRFQELDGTYLADIASSLPQELMLDELQNLGGHVFNDTRLESRAEAVHDMRQQWAIRAAKQALVTAVGSPTGQRLAAIAVCPPYWTNAVAQEILTRADFRYDGVDTCVEVAVCVDPNGGQVSLRSRDDGPDCSMIAEAYGGGGHPRAAGFRTSGVGVLNAIARKVLG